LNSPSTMFYAQASTGNVSIGTSTSQYPLSIFSSSNSQLALSAGAGLNMWNFRNAGGNLYVAPTTAAGNATSSSALTIIGSTGNVGIGSTTPWAQLSVNPNALGSGVPEFAVGSSTSTHLVVNGNGNVGIGTANPATTLHISNASSPASIQLGVSSAAGGYTSLITSLSAVSGGYASLQSIQSAGSAYGNLNFNPSGGNVGVG